MDIIRGDDFRKLIKKGLSGGYLFFGEEDYLKLHSLSAAREAVCSEPSFAFFNDMRLDATTFTTDALLNALTPLPMMAEQKIVSVSGLDLSSIKSNELDDLCDVLRELREYDYNVLIISVCEGGLDEGYLPKSPSTTLKKLSEFLTPVRFEQVPKAKLTAWCQKHFAHNGVSCDDEVCHALFARAGTSMFTLSAEIDKLSFYALSHGRNTVALDDVMSITCTTVEEDAFALSNALLDGNGDKALSALTVMKYNRVEPIIVLSEISKTFSDLYVVKTMLLDGKTLPEILGALRATNRPKAVSEYKVKIYMGSAAKISAERLRRAIELCAEADTAIKLSYNDYSPIENLLCTI